MKSPPRQTLFLLVVLVASFSVMGYLLWSDSLRSEQAEAAPNQIRPEQIPFDGQQAYEYLRQICALGPRISGTPAMQEQQKLVTSHFDRLGGKVSLQEFRVHHPQT